MTQEEKRLLLVDLCGRLPYRVNVAFYLYTTHEWFTSVLRSINPTEETYKIGNQDYNNFTRIKPYLRPMSSMTEEEKEYVKNRWCYEDWDDIYDFLNHYQIDAGDVFDFVDWLNAHHFDYRGLIEMGLAL